jgi:hypothetical protein
MVLQAQQEAQSVVIQVEASQDPSVGVEVASTTSSSSLCDIAYAETTDVGDEEEEENAYWKKKFDTDDFEAQTEAPIGQCAEVQCAEVRQDIGNPYPSIVYGLKSSRQVDGC